MSKEASTWISTRTLSTFPISNHHADHRCLVLTVLHNSPPFAALTGYDDAIKETGRLTDNEIDLSKETLNQLNMKFRVLLEMVDKNIEVAITYFVPDQAKSSGA